MITYKNGDIFTSTQPALGQGINCRGIMGSGIAVLFARKFPGLEASYIEACESGDITPGSLYPFQSQDDEGNLYPLTLNIASQDLPGANADYDFLRDGTELAFDFCNRHGFEGFALPLIGCGVGGLEWEDVDGNEGVKSILEKLSDEYPDVELEVWTFDE